MGLALNFNMVWGDDRSESRLIAWKSAIDNPRAIRIYATLAGERTLPPHKHHWAHGKEWPSKRAQK